MKKENKNRRLIDVAENFVIGYLCVSWGWVLINGVLYLKTGIMLDFGQYNELYAYALLFGWCICAIILGVTHNIRRQNGEIDGRTIGK